MSLPSSRRGVLGMVVLVLWLGGLGLLVRREIFRPHVERLADAGMRVTPSATFYAVMQQGHQIGFASSTIDTADGGIKVQDYLVADMPIAGRVRRATARMAVKLTRTLRVSSFTVDVDADLGPISASGRVIGDSIMLFVVRSATGQPADTQHIRLAGPVLLATLVPLAVALGEQPKTGAAYTLPIFDPLGVTVTDVRVHVRAESLFVVQDSSSFDRGTSRWVGVLPDTVRAWKLDTGTQGAAGFTGWVDEQGRVVAATKVLGLTLERRPYEVAFENWKADALQHGAVTASRDETTAIRMNKRLK